MDTNEEMKEDLKIGLSEKGFTLIELVWFIAFIGVVAAMLVLLVTIFKIGFSIL